jgi:transcriptional regulator with XRE-family HTH domain
MEQILQNIELIRKKKGIKQTVIAEQLGVKQNTYSQYITRNHDIKHSRLSQIADKLNVRVIDIITYPDIYVQETESCANCREKDKIIKNLNEYIEMLTKKK